MGVNAEANGGQIHLSVADEGMGIAPEELNHIFEEFYQLENPERDRSKGLGLGLAIVRQNYLGVVVTFFAHPIEMSVDRVWQIHYRWAGLDAAALHGKVHRRRFN